MIDLTWLECSAGEPRLIRKGATLRPIGAGADQRLAWIGDKFAIAFTAPPMPIEPDGRRLVADLQMAQAEGAFVEYPQPDFNVGVPGSPTVDGAVSGGTTLPITGGTPAYAVRKGQALSITRSGRSYLYFAAAQTILDAAGDGDILLTVMLRTQLAGGEAVNLARPIIEGWLDGDERTWKLDTDRLFRPQFTIMERA